MTNLPPHLPPRPSEDRDPPRDALREEYLKKFTRLVAHAMREHQSTCLTLWAQWPLWDQNVPRGTLPPDLRDPIRTHLETQGFVCQKTRTDTGLPCLLVKAPASLDTPVFYKVKMKAVP